MKKNCVILMILCLIGGILASCNKKEHNKKEVIIAIIPKIDNAIFDEVKQSAFEAARELGIVVTWEAPTSIDGIKQKEIIENLIHYKVNGILISCNDAEMLKEPINKAIKAGIKVATFDSDCPKSDRLFYVGTNNKKAGKICAETMLRLFERANKKPEQIVILSGGPTALNMSERLAGFQTVISSNNITDVLYSFEMPDFGNDLLSIALKSNKKINGIQMIWGVPALKVSTAYLPWLNL